MGCGGSKAAAGEIAMDEEHCDLWYERRGAIVAAAALPSHKSLATHGGVNVTDKVNCKEDEEHCDVSNNEGSGFLKIW